jgi:hypothetical protein
MRSHLKLECWYDISITNNERSLLRPEVNPEGGKNAKENNLGYNSGLTGISSADAGNRIRWQPTNLRAACHQPGLRIGGQRAHNGDCLGQSGTRVAGGGDRTGDSN